MRLKITGKNITLTEGIKSAVKDKIKKIEKLVGDDNDISEYVSYDNDAYHHNEAHCVIISGDFLTYVDRCIPEGETWLNRTPDASSEDAITTIDDVM